MLITKEVEVKIIGNTIKYYEDKGYFIPKFKNSKGKLVITEDSKIIVKVEDLNVNAKNEVEVKCDYCGEIYKWKYKDYMRKHNKSDKDCCKKCRGKKISETKLKYNFGDVVKIFQEKNMNIISLNIDYINTKSKIKYKCAICGYEGQTNLLSVLHGSACLRCANIETTNSLRLSFDYVKQYFEQNNCVLLSDEYKNASQTLKYICSCGRTTETTFNKFQKGSRCKWCGYERTGDFRRLSYKYIKGYFEAYGCELLSKNYIDANTPLKYKCSCGNISNITFGNFSRGQRCKICGMEKMKNNKYINGTMISSIPQEYLCKLFNGKCNYPLLYYFLDIAFPEENIYIEYDGSGHDLSVILGSITQEEFNQKELKRYYCLRNKKWKKIKITSPCDYLPSDKILFNEFNKALEWFKSDEKGHWHYNIEIGNKVNDTIYGKLRKIKNEDIEKFNYSIKEVI